MASSVPPPPTAVVVEGNRSRNAPPPRTKAATSLSQHLFQQFSVLIDQDEEDSTTTTTGTVTRSQRKTRHVTDRLLPYLQDPADAYIALTGTVHQAHLPAVPAWNSTFRKAYTVLFWIRVRLNDDDTADASDDDDDDDIPPNDTAIPSTGNQGPDTATDDGTDKEDAEDGTTVDDTDDDDDDTHKRILYRFSTAPEDADGTGVCVTCSQWKVVPPKPPNHHSNPTEEEDPNDDDDHHQEEEGSQQPRRLQTTLTAFALPYNNPAKLKRGGFLRGGGSASTTYSSWTQQSLTLTENTWHLVGCTHVYPYLKRPVWSVCVDGAMGDSGGELHYPVLSESSSYQQQQHHTRSSMEYCTVLQNVTAGGARVYNTTLYTEDDTKSASQLAAQIKAERRGPVLALTLDVAAVSLYSVAISAIVQAVVAEAGPCTGQQKFGHIIPTLPPVANWTKGCSLAGGPKVGIPLTVHGAALPVQQMAASSSSSSSSSGGGVGGGGNSSLLQFAASAVSARILGTASSQTTRLACPFRIQPGNTEIAPRVGLIQPVPPRQYVHGRSGSNMEEDLPVLYVTGQCTVVQALSEYLLHQGPGSDMDETVNEESDEYGMSAADDYDCGMLSGSLESSTQNWSTAWTEQQAVTFSVLPFFLALTPPIVERNITHAKKSPSAPVQGTPHPLLLASWKHLYTLYSENGIYAATLIRLLAALIRTGGARVHEEVLQNGILHVLASSLRLGLIRAIKHKLYTATSMAEFLSLAGKLDESPSSSSSSASPSYIPLSIAEAVAQLLDVCCGPPSTTIEELSPAMQIRRTSDVALTALFGLALDFDLWGGDLHAAAIVLTAVSSRYGGTGGCITTGYVLRSQIAVQHFLDQIRLLLRIESVLPTSNNKYDGTPIGETGRSTIAVSKQQALETVALSLSQLLQSILLSSLSNHRSIVQAEMDISACVAALTDCPLGTVTAHVILTAIVGVLTWCEILPAEAASSFLPKCHSKISITVSTNEEHKVEVASRLGRNLLVAQFHDVVAPVLLSRTVFSGDKTLASLSSQKSILPNLANVNGSSSLSWQKHWQLSLLLFSWVASIAGPEGVIASKSTGSLVLASAFAGSLEGALENSNKVVTVTLFMPSPAMALLIGATLRNEWSYKDLIADRLQIMIPMLPGMLVSLLSHPSDAISDKLMTRKALTTISDILTAVVGAFHRVFGGVSHGPSLQSAKKRGEGSSDEIKAARAYVPHLLVVAMILENHIAVRSPLSNKNGVIPIMRVPSHDDDNEMIDKVTQPDSWVDVAISSSTDLVGEIIVSAPEEHDLDISTLVAFLRSCQISVISTACGLIANSMSLGGAGAAIPLWTAILATLQESKCYAATDATKPRGPDPGAVSRDSISIPLITDSMKSSDLTQSWANEIAQNVLCRVISLVLLKSLKREQHWDAWEYELSSAIAKLFTLVEEKELLTKPAQVADNGTRSFSGEQIVLICSFLGVLAYGRQASGWCQLPLPPMDQSGDKTSGRSFGDLTAQSTLLLPVLRPCLRIVLQCLKFVDGETNVLMPTSSKRENEPQQLLGQIIPELNQTLTAAIVGLSFSTARDTALHAMTTFRRCHAKFKDTGDGISAEVCGSLFSKVAEELRVRYEIEQKMRKAAQVDAYNESGDKQSAREAARSSSAFERLIMGDVLLGDLGSSTEEITFNNDDVETNGTNVDFVIFPEMATTDQESKGMLGFTQVQGLHAALEECKSAPRKENETYTYVNEIAALSPFLDAWDEAAINDTQNVELVKLFETNFDINTGIHSYSMPILGSETAADAMSTFFEFAAVEKSRLQELLVRFLPGHRTSRRAFSDRFGWARYLELGPSDADRLFERTIPDGNRDVRSRLPTLPCSQQFRRYLPKYLDHGEDEIESTLIVDPISPISPEKDPSHRSSVGAIEMDAFTKSLLETGNLEIVDITKKEIDDEDDAGAIPSASGDLSDDEEDAGMYAETGPSLDQESDSTMNTMKKESTEINVTFSHEDETDDFTSDFVGKGHHNITTSSFSTPPDNSSSSLSLMHSAAAGMIEHHADNCTHVKPEGNRQCAVLLTSSHLIIEYDGNSDGFFEGEILAREEESDRQKRMAEDAVFSKEENPETQNQQADEKRQKETAGLRPKSIRWNLSEVSHIYLRRYRLRDSSLELFVIPSGGTSYGGFGLFSPASSLFLDFGSSHQAKTRRDDAAFAIMRRAPPQAIKQWPDRSEQFLHDQLSRLTLGWVEGRITNFDYLLHLNILSGRSYNDSCQYPVFPWVLADYTSSEIPDLTNRKSYRDLTKPVGALNPDRLSDFVERFNSFVDPSIPPFMYGSHYSTSAGVVLHYLVRLHPFAGLHRQLQGGHFDVADRLFGSVPRTWSMCTGSSAAEVKELTPEWYCNPSFLRNENGFKLGTTQDGEVMGDVVLPPWAKGSPEKFVEVLRAALESDICSGMLSDWIDLIFGRKQQGPEAIKAHNVFFYLTYYGTVDVASIEDESLRKATELQIAHFGQCPMQLFKRQHIRRLPRSYFNLSLYQILSSYTQRLQEKKEIDNAEVGVLKLESFSSTRAHLHSIFGEPVFLPFLSAPLSHWVHSSAPPPEPHSDLVAVRFAGTDRCLAVDAKGVFHYFRWAWKADELVEDETSEANPFDRGCFIAQRELPRFKTVPRLLYVSNQDCPVTVAISKTLFANRSVLLVLSDGDGSGSFGMQLVDPAKGDIKGEVLIPQVHAARITCIATDPIGTAAGHGGVGGELAIVGSADGNASLWRFMSSHFLPLRPRVRLLGHGGSKLVAVALCSAIHLAATLSIGKCCLHSTGSGALIRSFGPPINPIDIRDSDDLKQTTKFADSAALTVSVQGFVVTVCETTIRSNSAPNRTLFSLHLFTTEGISLGSTPLESWRGTPRKMYCTPDGTTVMVCCGRGVTMHRLSACQPLLFLDEFQVTKSDELDSSVCSALDIDLGPALNRPVVAVAACSGGALRLHALPGISAWSERHKKSGLSQTVGSALATPARRLKNAVTGSLGFGRQLAGIGRDLSREVSTDVKERGVKASVSGLLGNIMFRK